MRAVLYAITMIVLAATSCLAQPNGPPGSSQPYPGTLGGASGSWSVYQDSGGFWHDDFTPTGSTTPTLTAVWSPFNTQWQGEYNGYSCHWGSWSGAGPWTASIEVVGPGQSVFELEGYVPVPPFD